MIGKKSVIVVKTKLSKGFSVPGVGMRTRNVRKDAHMGIRITILICSALMFLFVLGMWTCSHADTVMNGLTPVAVVQGGQPYCGEAASAEALWAAGWALQASPQAVFQNLADHFQSAIWPSWGIEWYITTYWTSVQINDVLDVGPSTPTEIRDDINKGWAVDASWFTGSTGHALAVWGYDDNGFLLTNSWGSSAVIEVGESGFYGNYDLREVIGLVPTSLYVPSPVIIPTPVVVVNTPELPAVLSIAIGWLFIGILSALCSRWKEEQWWNKEIEKRRKRWTN